MFASSFDALLPFVFGIPVVLAIMALGSIVLSAGGHWSGAVLAVVPMLIGLILTLSIVFAARKDMLLPGLWIVFPAPLVLGVISLTVWFIQRSKSFPRGIIVLIVLLFWACLAGPYMISSQLGVVAGRIGAAVALSAWLITISIVTRSRRYPLTKNALSRAQIWMLLGFIVQVVSVGMLLWNN